MHPAIAEVKKVEAAEAQAAALESILRRLEAIEAILARLDLALNAPTQPPVTITLAKGAK